MTNKKAITELAGPKEPFGQMFNMEPLRREDGVFPQVIVVATNQGYGLMPKMLLLPQQLYLHTAQMLTEGYNVDLFVLPVYESNPWVPVILPKGKK